MLHKPLPQTKVTLPEIGLGTWNYHGGVEPLRKGIEAGAAFIDTAESYGSESVVGEAIAGRRSGVFLATKVSPSHFRYEAVIQAAEQSLRTLRIDYLDLYQLHEPNAGIPIAETMAAMEHLVDAGKVRFIGVSNFSAAELRAAQRVMGKHRIVANQVRYNLVDRTIEPELLPYCQAEGIMVIAYSPLAREFSRIRDADPQGVLDQIARETGKTPAQVAINWCLVKDSVVAIPKGNSVAHVLENCGASDWRLTEEQMKRLNEGILFRHRGRLDGFIRRHLPRQAIPLLKRILQRLPRGLKRRVN